MRKQPFQKTKDLAAAHAAYAAALRLAEQRLATDVANTAWQRDLSVSHDRIGNVLVAQGDGPGALAAYHKSLAIRQALAARDAANAQWQTDVAVSCARLGSLEHGQTIKTRRDYLLRGRGVLRELKSAGRLMPSQDRTEWFEQQLAQLPPEPS